MELLGGLNALLLEDQFLLRLLLALDLENRCVRVEFSHNSDILEGIPLETSGNLPSAIIREKRG